MPRKLAAASLAFAAAVTAIPSAAKPPAGPAPKAAVSEPAAAAPGVDRQAAPAPAAPPKLVLAIAVDQFSADLFAQYRSRFAAGLAKLQTGAVFPSGYQSHAATETCPGHSTLLTGARPARTGIIANNWFDLGVARADKRIYCSEDERDPTSTPRDPVVSPRQLKVPTLGERMKAVNRASRNVAVSAKDRAVMMMGGHDTDAAYWWKRGAFVTHPGRKPSAAADATNAAAARTIAAGAPAFALPAWCAPHDRAVAVGDRQVGANRFALAPGDESGFRVSPRVDAATADLAIALIDEMKLGQGRAPDMLSVSFSATDYIGHTYGNQGVEMCIEMAELDAAIGRLLDHLDARGIDYVAALSADHGAADAPERLTQQGEADATRVGAGLDADELAAAITARTGITVADKLVYADSPFGDFYLSRALSPADKPRALAALIDIVKAHPHVAAVFTAQDLAATPSPGGSPQDWTLIQRARASFDPQRSGDIVVLLDRAVLGYADSNRGPAAGHGSPWDYDRRVPMLFWRKGLTGEEQPAPVETVDIAPTLAAVLGLKVPKGEFDGRCLDIDGGVGDTCAGPKRN